ncbi:FecR family protein [Muricauda sp. MAR_2010_75]|uniref:FecR family protein n=1 Tax=Allomuricauda sp. MAR_2010_75 TaxID=1250232 RepID=UPI000A4F9BD8|nr:FecR domain-containing protein [Muricauda sp. MAR_2010_75]
MDSLLVKFLCDSANSHDLDSLNEWIQDQKHDSTFKQYVKTYYAITVSMNELDKKEIKQQLFKEIRKDKNVFYQKRMGTFFRYAALIVILFGVGFMFRNQFFPETESVNPTIVPRTDQITLQLDNGEVKVLNTDTNGSIQSANGNLVGIQKGNTIKYENAKQETIIYNTLKVPNAKRFNLVLSDGTKVHLNSGSSLRYPVSFLPGQKREVFLEGEAFLEVAHDKEHPFVVNAHDLNVEVLGTRFNLSDYGENSDTEVVLVDGLVSLEPLNNFDENSKVLLEPGYMGSFNRSNKNISKSKVNTSLYTSWVEGRIVIRNEPFENILIKLQRYYNVTIINNNESLAKERFNATIETEKETIEQVLNYFKQVYRIDYEVVENKVVIN